MNTPSSSLVRRRVLLASLVLCAATVIAAPQAEAISGAGGTILNTITVNYKDASGTTGYSASATSSVTINQVKAGLSLSGMPTPAAKGKTAALPVGQTINSGATSTYLIALTANANGGDTYNLGDTNTPNVNMASQSVTWATVQNDGNTVIAGSNPTTVALGASVIQSNTATTISIPGGSNLVAKITTNAAGAKVLVVNGIDYIVSSIVDGRPASNTNVGATLYNNVGTPTTEILDVITLAANPSGANVAPAFTVNGLVGTQVGEQILVKVTVTGIVGAAVNTPGTVPFTVTTTDGASLHPIATTVIVTTFNASNLQIRKSVRNCGQATAVGSCGAPAVGWAATATGNPGDILEYKVEVINAGASQASVVSAQDAVPVYTSLITFTTSTYGDSGTAGTGLPAQYFAQVTDGTTTGSLTMQSSDTEVANIGAGDAAGTTANSAIHFFLGTGTSNSAGGSIAAAKAFTILYRMKVN
jgi:hypothetical protein